MVKAKITRETRVLIDCPSCQEGRFDVTHLFRQRGNSGIWNCFGPWMCENCGQEVVGKISPDAENPEVDLELVKSESKRYYDVLKLDTDRPVFFILKDRHKTEYLDNLEFRYEEHSCPTNFIGQTALIVYDKDTDPHGIFEYVGSVEEPQSHQEDCGVLDNITYEELNELLGGALGENS